MPPTHRTRLKVFVTTTMAAVAMVALSAPGAGAAPASSVKASAPTLTAPVARKATAAERQIIYALRKRVVATAMTKLEARYVWGGAGPDVFDCSGLVMWTYLAATGIALPHYSGAQMQVTRPVARTRLRRGDLLFYGPGGSSHVTMYIGRRMQIGASSPRSGIVVDSIDSPYRVANYAGAGRVVTLAYIRGG